MNIANRLINVITYNIVVNNAMTFLKTKYSDGKALSS